MASYRHTQVECCMPENVTLAMLHQFKSSTRQKWIKRQHGTILILEDSTRGYISLHCQYLKYFDDLQLRVHDQDVLFLWFALLDVTLWSRSKRSHGQEPTAPEHHLGHQLTDPVDGSHHIAPFGEARKELRLGWCCRTATAGQGPFPSYKEKFVSTLNRPGGELCPRNRRKPTEALQYFQTPPALSLFHQRHYSVLQPRHEWKEVDFKPTLTFWHALETSIERSLLSLIFQPYLYFPRLLPSW